MLPKILSVEENPGRSGDAPQQCRFPICGGRLSAYIFNPDRRLLARSPTWTVVSLTQDAWMVREEEANAHVFKDSASCLEPLACSDASRAWTGRSDDNPTYSSNDTSTTSKDLFDASNFSVSHSPDAGRDLCTPATFLDRILLLAVMDEIPFIS